MGAFGVRCHSGREGPKVDKDKKRKRDTRYSLVGFRLSLLKELSLVEMRWRHGQAGQDEK